MKLINIGSIVDTLLGDYFGDKWDFIIIGNDEGVLEFLHDTEVVLGIVSLGSGSVSEDYVGWKWITETGASYGHTGSHANAVPFHQVYPGEVRLFDIPSHSGTFHVSPCAIVFGSSSYGDHAKKTTSLAVRLLVVILVPLARPSTAHWWKDVAVLIRFCVGTRKRPKDVVLYLSQH
jgi:hypothetical protein